MKTLFVGIAMSVLVLSRPAPAPQDEEQALRSLPLSQMVAAIRGDEALAERSFYYDPGFQAVGSFAVHNHFAKRVCMGYLVSDGESLAYRFIRSFPGMGSDNDAFQTELSNVSRVEYKFYRASKGFLDAFPERLSVKIWFDEPISGLVAGWKKDDIKFDVWDVQFGYTLVESLKELGVPVQEKN